MVALVLINLLYLGFKLFSLHVGSIHYPVNNGISHYLVAFDLVVQGLILILWFLTAANLIYFLWLFRMAHILSVVGCA